MTFLNRNNKLIKTFTIALTCLLSTVLICSLISVWAWAIPVTIRNIKSKRDVFEFILEIE